jgi:hypothetical protein
VRLGGFFNQSIIIISRRLQGCQVLIEVAREGIDGSVSGRLASLCPLVPYASTNSASQYDLENSAPVARKDAVC